MTSTNEDGGTPSGRRTHRWLWTGLVLSLAVNLLVAGFIIGAAWHRGGFKGGGHERSFRAFLRKLPDDRRALLRRKLREERETLVPFREKLRESHVDWERILTADPFNLEAFSSANQRVHESRAALGARRAEIIPALVAVMTAEERQRFLKWHRHRWRRGRWRR